ncbi:MAG TPA: entericidin A/B family lipoprotein [Thiobacillus sp.]
MARRRDRNDENHSLMHGLYWFLKTAFPPNLLSGGFIMFTRVLATLLTMLSIAGATAILAGCNTVEGAGKDIQQAGGAIKDEANEHK